MPAWRSAVTHTCGADADDRRVINGEGESSMRTGLFILLSSFFFAASAYGEVKTESDRFTGETTISLTTKPSGVGSQDLFVTGKVKPDGTVPGGFIIMFVSIQNGWKYLRCHSMHWLLDGKPLEMPDTKHDGEVGNGGGMVIEEIVTLGVSEEKLRAIGHADKIEYEICNDAFTLKNSEHYDLNQMFQKLDSMRPAKPAD
jgi:hypothetical protein